MNDPYAPAAYANQAARPGGPVQGHHPAIKWIYLGVSIASLGLYAAQLVATFSYTFSHITTRVPSVLGPRAPSPLLDDPTTQVFTGLYVLAAIIAAGVGLTWLGFAWAAIPEGYRVTAGGTRVSPTTAVGFSLIPCFNYYWTFVAVVGLTDALNGAMAASGLMRRAPRALAVAACVCYVVPCTTILVAPILWFVLMWQMDAALKEYLAQPPTPAYAPPPMMPYGA